MISEYKPKYKLFWISDFLFEDARQKLLPILKFFFAALSEELHFIKHPVAKWHKVDLSITSLFIVPDKWTIYGHVSGT